MNGRDLDLERARAELARRYEPIVSRGAYITAFRLPDGREIAIQDTQKVVVWMENAGSRGDPPVPFFEKYEPSRGRNTNLPGRLNHRPSAELESRGFPCPVVKLTLETMEQLIQALDWYDGKEGGLSRPALEQLREVFLQRCPDFRDFARKEGTYHVHERLEKDILIGRMAGVLNEKEKDGPLAVGEEALGLLATPPTFLVGWRLMDTINKTEPETRQRIATALGQLLLSGKADAGALSGTAALIHPLLLSAGKGRSYYAGLRSFVTAPLALARPAEAMAVKTSYLEKAARLLLGRKLFEAQPLSAGEYEVLFSMATRIFEVMRDEWLWEPRDLWDVQGFLWVATSESWGTVATDSDQDEIDMNNASPSLPTNLILYGPPGTGKTYATAEEAVRLCDGADPGGGRGETMARYRQLQREGRIHFVTFHQSYAYEDFVEGLRPDTGPGDDTDGTAGSGFRLRPTDGIFKKIVALAGQTSRIPGEGTAELLGTMSERRFFKLSLGNPSEATFHDEAIAGGCIAIGWGGEIDWSDEKFDSAAAIQSEWAARGEAFSKRQGYVDQTNRFRNTLSVGDIVVIPEGGQTIRAIGEVTGPYEFVPDSSAFQHRRKVRWLKVFSSPVPRELIYDRDFKPMTIYEMSHDGIRMDSLRSLISGTSSGPETRPYVLVIDEINRANVSKVFGELITLLESDKRLGMENEIRVTLPYSGDEFGVPLNLHIIGTMNSADRSIALLDTALRRRFEFRAMMPRYDVGLLPVVDGIDLAAVLRSMNERIEFLYDRDHQIGHAFFIGCDTRPAIDRVMRSKIIPLLMEYFHEDWEKVRQVLNERDDAGVFIARRRLGPTEPDGEMDFPAERYRYTLRDGFAEDAYEILLA